VQILIELRHLRYFLAVAETAHFTRAAEAIYVSQPTLSQQIKQLEEDLGTTLFDRIGKRVMLTEAGEILQVHAQRIFTELEQAQQAIQELEGLQGGELAVGVVQTVNAYMIPDLVARFTATYPKISLRIQELSADEIESRIEQGKLHLGISFIPPTSPFLEVELLFDEKLVLILPTSHRLATQKLVRFDELKDEALILLPPGFYTRRLVDEGLKTAGACAKLLVEMNTIGGVLATVQATGAATVLPALALRLKEAEGLCAVELAAPALRRNVGLLWRREGYRRAAARTFAAIAVATIGDDFLPLLQNRQDGGMKCPRCHSTQINKNGCKRGKQRYICKNCARQFTVSKNL